MDLFDVFIRMALIGLGAWAITAVVPMPAKIAQIIIVVATIFVVLIALSAFGLISLPLR